MTAIKISLSTARTYRTTDGMGVCWAWACEQFGNPGSRWQHDTYQTYLFRDESDAVLFALRWS